MCVRRINNINDFKITLDRCMFEINFAFRTKRERKRETQTASTRSRDDENNN